MPGLLIRDLPDRLHRKLKERAAAHRRSMNQEALEILEAALEERAGPPPLQEIDALRMRGPAPLTDAVIREARTAGRP